MRANELVVGARGELYKCWDSVGNPHEVIGHLRSWRDPNDRVLKWLRYDPFTDEGLPLVHRAADLHGRLRPPRR